MFLYLTVFFLATFHHSPFYSYANLISFRKHFFYESFLFMRDTFERSFYWTLLWILILLTFTKFGNINWQTHIQFVLCVDIKYVSNITLQKQEKKQINILSKFHICCLPIQFKLGGSLEFHPKLLFRHIDQFQAFQEICKCCQIFLLVHPKVAYMWRLIPAFPVYLKEVRIKVTVPITQTNAIYIKESLGQSLK